MAVHLIPLLLAKVLMKAGGKLALRKAAAHHGLGSKIAKEGAKKVLPPLSADAGIMAAQ